jgi:hypothetical protein
MKAITDSHRFADKIIPCELIDEMLETVKQVGVKSRHGAAPEIRKAIGTGLISRGWSDRVALSPQSDISITSVKDRIGLCLQLGNMARMYADLLKLQTLFVKDAIVAGILILPTADCAKTLGSNLANSGRFLNEMPIYAPVITAPLLIVSIE